MGVFLKKHRMAFTLPGCCAALTLLYMAAFSGVSAEGVRDALLRYGDLAPVIYMLLFAVLPAFFFPVGLCLPSQAGCCSDCCGAAYILS